MVRGTPPVRLVASRPGSQPLPDRTRDALAGVSAARLRKPVARVAVPRPRGSPGHTAARLRSDHAPFWRVGLPAVFWTDTAEFRNPHYHRPTDTPDTPDYAFLAGVARLLAHAILTGTEGRGASP